MSRWTVIGADGSIGSRLVGLLRREGHVCDAYGRHRWPSPGEDLGVVVYAAGITADFRSRLADTMEAHVSSFLRLLRECPASRVIYLSSTRVYGGGPTLEEAAIPVRPSDPDHLYNVSKLAGESACLSLANRPLVVRLSNVVVPEVDSPQFLPSVLREAVLSGRVVIGQAPTSSKDYVWIDDVLAGLVALGREGPDGIVNLSSGVATTHAEIATFLGSLGIGVEFAPAAPESRLPAVGCDRLVAATGMRPRALPEFLPHLYKSFLHSLKP